LEVEVWYESPDGEWAVVPDLGGQVDLRDLKEVEKGMCIPDNTLEFTLASAPKAVFYLPSREDLDNGVEDEEKESGGAKQVTAARVGAQDLKGVMERSLRETRMKRGAGVGALHQ
jgi:hypothetical protein